MQTYHPDLITDLFDLNDLVDNLVDNQNLTLSYTICHHRTYASIFLYPSYKITTLPPSIDALYPHFGLNQLPLLTSPSIPPLSLTRLLAVTSSNRNPSMTRPQPIGSSRTRMTSKPKKPPPLPSLATWSKVSLTNDADNLEFWGQTTSLRRLIQTMHTTKGGGPWPRWWNAFELLKVNHRRIVIKAVKSLPRPVHQKPRPTLSLIRPPLPYHHRITSPYTNMTPLFPALLPHSDLNQNPFRSEIHVAHQGR